MRRTNERPLRFYKQVGFDVADERGDEPADSDGPLAASIATVVSRLETSRLAPEIFASVGNLAAERNVTSFGGVVLRFGLFIGPTAASARLLLGLARRRVTPVLGRGDGYVSSIHLDDGGRAVVAALDAQPGTGQNVPQTASSRSPKLPHIPG